MLTLKSEVIVCFVDIGGIVDHDCLNFPFIITNSPIYMFDFSFRSIDIMCKSTDCLIGNVFIILVEA